MSLDDTFDRMRAFEAALERFDEALRGSLENLSARHADAEALWQDAFAREYAAVWLPLAEGLQHWCRHEGPQYREFVGGKLRALAHYLEEGR